ncbi:hypothetical protein [Myxococcus sp. CA039A]|uniref:hypothetical protein n=1 Tax=Myxococcus sp. CA039A TaxID=2741737 RepID=UPI00157AA493|nr:hypothetical protein [Myxococcus sp. CA039A]NTX51592.1 hypothetical protein [Myxococcus sp. CA039A]
MAENKYRHWNGVFLWVLLLGLGCTQSPGGGAGAEPVAPESLVTQEARVVTSSYVDLRLRVGRGVAVGRTCGAANEVTPACGGGSGPDLSFHFIAPYDGSYTFVTDPLDTTDYDTVVQVTDWHSSASLGCNDNASASTLTSSAILNLARNQEVRITVDGKNGSCGRFMLNILVVESTCGPCNTPPGPCFSPYGSCSGATCVYSPLTAGAVCNDGNACTLNDKCGATGSCVGTTVSCNSAPGTCYASPGTCNPATGACGYAARPAGTACNDGDSCTQGDACYGGACYGGDRVCCPNGVLCNGGCCAQGDYCIGGTCRPMCLTQNVVRTPENDMLPACPMELQ